jgi:hypothetical protein
MLYARVRRIATLMGYSRTITDTLPTESGASLRGAGFEPIAKTKGGSWDTPSRRRIDAHPTCPKLRWEASAQ